MGMPMLRIVLTIGRQIPWELPMRIRRVVAMFCVSGYIVITER